MTNQGRYNPRPRGDSADDIVSRAAPIADVRAVIGDTNASHVQKLDQMAKEIGRAIYQHVTTSQIRGIFSVVREIEQETLALRNEHPLEASVTRRLSMIRPKLAYQVGRIDGYPDEPKKAQMGALTSILTTAIDAVLEIKTVQAFRNFVDFFEAILAYHKFYGGKDKAQQR